MLPSERQPEDKKRRNMSQHIASTRKNDETREVKFDADKFTPQAAKNWLKEQGFEILDFVEASPEQAVEKAQAPKMVQPDGKPKASSAKKAAKKK
jgi:predicted ATPase